MATSDTPHLTQLENRAEIAMSEVQAMKNENTERVTEHCRGSFDNQAWLSAELRALKDRFRRVEDVVDEMP